MVTLSFFCLSPGEEKPGLLGLFSCFPTDNPQRRSVLFIKYPAGRPSSDCHIVIQHHSNRVQDYCRLSPHFSGWEFCLLGHSVVSIAVIIISYRVPTGVWSSTEYLTWFSCGTWKITVIPLCNSTADETSPRSHSC